MRTFEFSDAKGQKFWNIEVTDNYYTVKFGKVGSTGQKQRKTFATAAEAQADMDRLIREKLKQGFVETTPKPVASEEAAFQKALTENPDDIAGWSAYADWLVEQGDPRGEFMQTQLALEDESRPKKDRDALKKKEKALLKKHEEEWLGGLAAFVNEEEDEDDDDDYTTQTQPVWRRGVLAGVIIERLNMALAQALANDPAARFVRELQVNATMCASYGEDVPNQPKPRVKKPKGVQEHDELFELIGSPLLANLRVFQYGDDIPDENGWCDCHTYAQGLEHLVGGMKRVEVLNLYCKGYESAPLFKLTNLTHLRELRIYHLGGYDWDRRYEYALDVLAKNPTFANLTHLLFHPHGAEGGDEDDKDKSYIPLKQVQALVRSPHLKKLTHLQLRLSDMGDDGVREIIASGILKQLKWLDLRHGAITDAGANLFAASPDAKNLEHLDLSRNGVSAKGLSALRKAGIKAEAKKPLKQNELEEREYLREGDFE